MTALPITPDERFYALPCELVNDALVGWEDPEDLFEGQMRQSRDGEELQGIALGTQIRALYTSPWFWQFCAEVFPNNNVLRDDRGEGAPQHFPDWFLFLVNCAAGMTGHCTIKTAVDHFNDDHEWRNFVARVDAYVPEGMARLRDLPKRKPNKVRPPKAKAGSRWSDRAVAMEPNPDVVVPMRFPVAADGLSRHHMDHFKLRWRGEKKKRRHETFRRPIPVGDPDYGMRNRAFEAFRRMGIDQAHAMSILHPEGRWLFNAPDRNACIGGDGVVFPFTKTKPMPGAEQHVCGGEEIPVYGSKFTIISARINGQYMSRLILDLGHTHKDHEGSAKSEAQFALESVPHLHQLSGGGIRALLWDSAIRGKVVEALQRQGIVVVNYPHAAKNPGGGAGKRLNPTRTEKSKLRTTHNHINKFGKSCDHPIYAVGGELIELVTTANGTDAPRHLIADEYQRRGKPGKYREYRLVTLDCMGDALRVRVPLFHTDGPSNDPRGVNWGEVSRVFAPGSPQFKYLYGARNDTEARHDDLKARMKHLPRDVRGQEFRLLGASMSINAAAWQVHLQAHGQRNVIDDTA